MCSTPDEHRSQRCSLKEESGPEITAPAHKPGRLMGILEGMAPTYSSLPMLMIVSVQSHTLTTRSGSPGLGREDIDRRSRSRTSPESVVLGTSFPERCWALLTFWRSRLAKCPALRATWRCSFLAAHWSAILLLDEAAVFLERRST